MASEGSSRPGGSKRRLLIPEKRKLLPPRPKKVISQTNEPGIVFKNPRPKETAHSDESEDNDEDASDKPTRIEFDFASTSRPFLDPSTWEAMLKKSREESAMRGGDTDPADTVETPEEQARREKESEYGSMAIRGRSSISGRGRRGRGTDKGHWAGRH
ncbi:hypothetical protein N7532_003877 [Penicillium argentinense]|uniref:Uncharacterized protein n=1 Tax=Penicillium argentinense TaxID=1131581 RepID=A0A9W9KF38_9EURO|nr:uncharacterized protein N7532_003877 [Penicillium argentinense]KAJ5103348.1 hypothetical protein N7532_003877 [Penicillium argentinense]